MDSIPDSVLLDKVAKRKAYNKRYQETHLEDARVRKKKYRVSPKGRAAQKRYEESHPEVKAAKKARQQSPESKAYQEVYRQSPKGRAVKRAHRLKREYGISLADYDRMFAEQKGLCKACGKKTKLVVDHDHVTNKVRGLLCHQCNVIAGMAHDKPTHLMMVAEYLVACKQTEAAA